MIEATLRNCKTPRQLELVSWTWAMSWVFKREPKSNKQTAAFFVGGSKKRAVFLGRHQTSQQPAPHHPISPVPVCARLRGPSPALRGDGVPHLGPRVLGAALGDLPQPGPRLDPIGSQNLGRGGLGWKLSDRSENEQVGLLAGKTKRRGKGWAWIFGVLGGIEEREKLGE